MSTPPVRGAKRFEQERKMELADPRIIEEMLAAHARISRVRAVHKKHSFDANASMAPGSKVRRCHCGICPRCREEARWDRIFNERFADPDYYKQRPTRFGSSMGWLTGDAAT